MAYAVIDYYDSKWSYKIKTINDVGKLDILLPHFRNKKSKKYAKKVLKILNESNIKMVVVNKELLKNNDFCAELYENKKDIVTGRNMYKSIILRVIKDVSSQMKIDIKKLKVVMLVDDYSVENSDLIKTVAKEVKSLTVVTTNKDKFEMLIKDLFNDYGIILKIVEKNTINFKNSNILINVDFQSYDMNKISMTNNSLIICGFAKNYVVKPNFEGIVIKDIDVVDVTNNNSNIDDLSLCEAKIYTYLRKHKENDRMFEREGFRINGYFGQNGKIRGEEFKKLGQKLLDK